MHVCVLSYNNEIIWFCIVIEQLGIKQCQKCEPTPFPNIVQINIWFKNHSQIMNTNYPINYINTTFFNYRPLGADVPTWYVNFNVAWYIFVTK